MLAARCIGSGGWRYLDLGVVGNGGLAVVGGHRHLKDAKVVLGHGRRVAVPIVEVANQVCTQGVGSPFAVDDVAIGLDVEAKPLETLQAASVRRARRGRRAAYARELFQAALCVVNCLDPFLRLGEAALERVFEGLEIAVELDDACAARRD